MFNTLGTNSTFMSTIFNAHICLHDTMFIKYQMHLLFTNDIAVFLPILYIFMVTSDSIVFICLFAFNLFDLPE